MKKIDFRYATPNIITLIGLCLGINSLKLAFEGNFQGSINFILLAAILDALDGRIARLIKGTSKFGAELDSLTDFVNFGICPSIIIYFWSLNFYDFYGWIVTLIYIVACCLRLARFNINQDNNKNNWQINFFTGVPAPAAAGIILLPMILSFSKFHESLNLDYNVICIFTVIFVSFLMVSKIPTYAVKKIQFTKNTFILFYFLIVSLFSFLFFQTFETLVIIGFVYIFSIPISFFHYLKYSNPNKKNKLN